MIRSAARLWEPPNLRQAPEEDSFWNALVSHLDQDRPIGPTARLTAALTPPPAQRTAALLLRVGARSQIVACPVAFPFAAGFGADLSLSDLAALPPVLRDALYEGMAAALVTALPPDRIPGPFEIVSTGSLIGVEAARDAPAPLRWFRLTLCGLAPEPVVVDVGATLGTLRDLLGAGLRPQQVSGGLEARLTRGVDVTLGRLALTVAALRDLTAGAVIVLEGTLDPAVLRLRDGHTGFSFEAEDAQWRCTATTADETPDGVQSSMGHDQITDPAAQRSASSLGLLDVMVDFDIGRMNVPLGEIETWRPGSVVALQPVLPRDGIEVTLRVNGRPIATGDLIEIDGRVAIRLATLKL